MSKALESVLDERARQQGMWGTQDHTLPVWLAIWVEEVGEAAKEIVNAQFKHPNMDRIREEIVHATAVGLQIIEWIDGRDDA